MLRRLLHIAADVTLVIGVLLQIVVFLWDVLNHFSTNQEPAWKVIADLASVSVSLLFFHLLFSKGGHDI